MKGIDERANLAAWQIFEEIGLSKHSVDRVAEIITEKIQEQKAIDEEEIRQLHSIMEKSASVLGIGTKWFNENGRRAAIAKLKQEILNYLSD